MKNHLYEYRKFVLGGIALAIVVCYIVRLAFLQLSDEEYKSRADNNAFFNNVIFPARGTIYDRNDSLLVFNQPAYDIMVIMREVNNLDTLDFCQTVGITRQQFDEHMATIKDRNKNPGYSTYTQQLFMPQISAQEYGIFQEKMFRFHGFYLRERTIRRYATDHCAHILGDVAEVSSAEVEKDSYYTPGDYIGKLGVERFYEKQLRGEKGRESRGRIQGHYRNGEFDRKPVPGKNITLSIDAKLQALGERLMEGKMGAIVAIEPKTGEILCMVSAPSYDPHRMEGKQRGVQMMEMQRDPMKPMLNRAISGTYPPGSTFKTSQGLTFLQ